jgi:hypothetical protein
MTGSPRDRVVGQAASLSQCLILGLVCCCLLVTTGCGTRRQLRDQKLVDDFTDESRQLGLRIYGLEARIERLEDERQSLPTSRRSERSYNRDESNSVGNGREEFDESLLGPPVVDEGPSDSDLPDSDLPDSEGGGAAGGEMNDGRGPGPGASQGAGLRHDEGRPNVARLNPAERTYRDLANAGQQVVSRVRIAKGSGSRDFDGEPGDDGMSLMVQPLDRDGAVVAIPGPISVALQDADRTQTVARWEFSAQEVEEAFTADMSGAGYRLDMTWQTTPPPTDRIHVFVLYRGPGGAESEAHEILTANLPPLASRNETGRESNVRDVAREPSRPDLSRGWTARTLDARVAPRKPGPTPADREAVVEDTGPTASVYNGGGSRTVDSSDSSRQWRATR